MAKMLLDKAGIKYVVVDAEENVDLTKKFGVKKAPTLLVPNDGGFESTCLVKILNNTQVATVTLNKTALEIKPGASFQLTATVLPTTATNKTVTWSSSNNSVATVDNGLVNALTIGTTTVTATAVDGGAVGKCEVTVTNEVNLWDKSQDSLRTGTKTLDFYSFNDFHGTVEYNGNDEPGINMLSTFVKNEKAKNPEGFVLTNSGDLWQGSADSNITRGRLTTSWQNILGCDAMGLGNHEFDWTIDKIKENMTYANYPIICSNIIYQNTNQPVEWIEPFTTITRNGVHIGIIGTIGEGITGDILAANVRGLKFAEPTQYVNKWANYLRENGADVILLLHHDSVDSLNSNMDIDLAFCGHSHQREKTTQNGFPAVQAWCNGKSLGHINLTYDFSKKSVKSTNGEYIYTNRLTPSTTPEDPETKAMYDEYLKNEISVIKDEVVSTYTGGISKYDIPNVYNNYAYMYYQEVVPQAEQKEIAFVWTNNARSDILASPKGITYGDIYKALPFDNTLDICSATGSYLKTISSYGTMFIPGRGETSFYDVINSLDSSKTYYFLAIDYIAESNYYYGNFQTEKMLEEDALPRNILKRYIGNYPNNVIA